MRVVWITIAILLSGSIAAAQDMKPAPGQTSGQAGAIRAQRPVAKEKPKEKPSATEAEAAKARAAAEAREKARDTRMRRDLRSICTGCSPRAGTR